MPASRVVFLFLLTSAVSLAEDLSDFAKMLDFKISCEKNKSLEIHLEILNNSEIPLLVDKEAVEKVRWAFLSRSGEQGGYTKKHRYISIGREELLKMLEAIINNPERIAVLEPGKSVKFQIPFASALKRVQSIQELDSLKVKGEFDGLVVGKYQGASMISDLSLFRVTWQTSFLDITEQAKTFGGSE